MAGQFFLKNDHFPETLLFLELPTINLILLVGRVGVYPIDGPLSFQHSPPAFSSPQDFGF